MTDQDLASADKICKTLEESTYYAVRVSLRPGNPPHDAILYTGFRSGGYRCIWGATYEGEVSDLSKARIVVIGKAFP
jgi:hypothetical protein